MKLRNKKTGEIVEVKSVKFHCENEDGDEYQWSKCKKFDGITLAELKEEWEDYEEPKKLWEIDRDGRIFELIPPDDAIINPYWKNKLEIGNYFETKEEAEKAVEKLKAWKRLQDTGFKFKGLSFEVSKDFGSIFFEITKDKYKTYYDCVEFEDDLNLLFGGEE